MLKQTIYIGPLQFEIELSDGCEDLGSAPEFEQRISSIHKVYFVRMELWDYTKSSDGITLDDGLKRSGQITYEGNGFDDTGFYKESQQDGWQGSRYIYQLVDGRKRYYARTSLDSNYIHITLNRQDPMIVGRRFEVWRYLMLEKLLIRQDAFILHSASIIHRGQAVLFSAPSGTGKSTQADLWKKYEPGTVGLNGDRNILYREDGKWFVCGLPWHGTSEDCQNIKVPLKAIAVIRQAEQDSIQELSPVSKLMAVYSEITLDSADRNFVEHVLTLVSDLIAEVTIVQQNCTMNVTAVRCLQGYLTE